MVCTLDPANVYVPHNVAGLGVNINQVTAAFKNLAIYTFHQHLLITLAFDGFYGFDDFINGTHTAVSDHSKKVGPYALALYALTNFLFVCELCKAE